MEAVKGESVRWIKSSTGFALLMFSFISSIAFLIWSISFSKCGTLREVVPLNWLSGSAYLLSSWLWVCLSVFPSRCCLLELSSLVNSWFWRVNSAMAAAMDCTCWTEDGYMAGANWWSRWGLLEASLLSWGPRLVTLDLVRTISALCRWKELQNSRKWNSKNSNFVSHRRRQLMILRLLVGWTIFGAVDLQVVSKSWKDTISQRRPVEVGQESSDG